MTIYTCEEKLEAMMTCIYTAWEERLGPEHIRLEVEPLFQQELFASYIHVDVDREKAQKVVRSIQRKISFEAWQQVYLAAMSDDPVRLDAIYRFLRLGFAYGKNVTHMLAVEPVMELMRIKRRTENEMHYYREFARFSSVEGNVYVSHVEPKCNVLAMTAEHFADRMPSEYWMMIDDKRRIAAVHPKDQAFYMTELSDGEFLRLRETEKSTDLYTELWQIFFHAIGIEKRKNPVCQRNLLPLWHRNHMTEFMG